MITGYEKIREVINNEDERKAMIKRLREMAKEVEKMYADAHSKKDYETANEYLDIWNSFALIDLIIQ